MVKHASHITVFTVCDGTYTGTGSGKHAESVVGTIVCRGGCISCLLSLVHFHVDPLRHVTGEFSNLLSKTVQKKRRRMWYIKPR